MTYRKLLGCILLLCFFISHESFAISHEDFVRNFHPVIALGTGTAFTSQTGRNQNFPIQNPLTDQFYQYHPTNSTQAASFVDFFIGNEFTLTDKLLLQAGINYNQTGSLSSHGTLIQGIDMGSANVYQYHFSIITRQLLLMGKLLTTFKQYFHPYVMAGMGAAFNNANNFYTSVPPLLTFTKMYSHNMTTSFSYALGLGLDTDLTNNLRFGIGYRFTNLGKIQTGSATIDNNSISGTLSQSHMNANLLLAQLELIF